MKRHYFISDDLDDLERIEQELERRGINKPQIHVLSKDDAAVARHRHLHNIEAVFKQDVVNGTLLGAMFGILAATLVLMFGYMSSLTETYTWMPFYFLAIVMFGFLTWSGGFYGIQTPHKDFRRFQKDLNKGKHVFIVDIDPSQEEIIQQIKTRHPHLNNAGTGNATPRWIVMGQQSFKNITSSTFP
jgi:hypothetical protein